MHSVDLVYVKTLSAMLERFNAEYQNARASRECDRAKRLSSQIAELRARRDRMMASLFGFDPVIGSH
jgi:uncharacterized membrane protein (DUF106 family)